MNGKPRFYLTGWQQFFVVLLRVGIGWHFLREGIVKLAQPNWTAQGYLMGSWGPLSPIFNTIGTLTIKETWGLSTIYQWFLSKEVVSSPDLLNQALSTHWMLEMSNFLMPWMLTIAGAGLMLGLFTRLSTLIAMTLLAMFYAATPPLDLLPVFNAWPQFFSDIQHAQWAGKHMINTEGNYLIVNKNMLEFLALAALASLDSGLYGGLDNLLRHRSKMMPPAEKTEAPAAVEAAT